MGKELLGKAVDRAGELMDKNDVGSIIVLDKKGTVILKPYTSHKIRILKQK